MHRFAYLLSLPLALSTGCFNPSGGTTVTEGSTGPEASSTTVSTTAPTSDPTTGPTTGDTTQSATVSSTDPFTSTLPGTTDLSTTTTDLTGTTAITDTTLTTLPGTTDVPLICGDGATQDGEQCDDGNLSDGDGCSALCTIEVCGDAIKNNGDAEECDDGNDVNTDDCLVGCKKATCGDSFKQAGVEECDDSNTAEGDGCDQSCKLENLSVFLTDAKLSSVQVHPTMADLHCDNVAKVHFPNRTFVAWVSTKELPAKARLGMPKGRKYVLGKTQTVVAENFQQLVSGTLLTPINIDESETIVPLAAEPNLCEDSTNYVWTGTNGDGTGTDLDCNKWSPAMVGTGTVGTIAASDFKWTNKCARGCFESYRIVCIQKETL
jgi:cysteine-rich repeat protein